MAYKLHTQKTIRTIYHIKPLAYRNVNEWLKISETWASTIAYVYDDKYNFYWVSLPNSQHQQNIAKNPTISFTIFDSHQPWGEGIGVQIEANVSSTIKRLSTRYKIIL